VGGGTVSRPGALLFDFDGLILDTETCTYETVVEIFAEHGATLDVGWWHSILGNGGHAHWTEVLGEQLGRPLDRPVLVARAERRRLAVMHTLPVCAGVADLLDAAAVEGVPAAVASSSSADWVEGHLARLGLRDRFDAVITRDDVGGDGARTKPEPDLFLVAAEALAVEPARCVVLEDSPNGVAAGRAAGMAVVAVPGPMTASLDLSAAHLVVPSLVEVDLRVLGSLLAAG
ncbi:MAG: HAD-IA family hydrolase, partial [Acidimicrobiales bacterium]|nr:HAD-IA family hydrolase [Acidimicrobiales bacterium]